MRRPPELRSAKPLLWSSGTGTDVWDMFQAAAKGDVPALRRLLKRDPSLARCHFEYRTPIYFAVRENQLQTAKLLLGEPGDPLSLAVNNTLLTTARERGYQQMVTLLERFLDARGEPVAEAIRQRKRKKLRKLLDDTPSLIHARDERGNQPIHWAAMTRQLKVIDELLARGADINAKRPDGAQPIQLVNGDYNYRGWRDVPAGTKTKPADVLRHLRKRGATVELCVAARIGDMDRVKELLAQDPSLANKPSAYVSYYALSGTPLRNAADGGHLEIVRLLLEHAADPNLPEEGIAPLGHALHTAVCRGHREVVTLLLNHGALPNVPVESSADTLSAAIRNEDKAMVDLLASRGAVRSVELLAYYGETVTAAALVHGNPALANDREGLCNAAREGHEPFVRLLLHHTPGLPKRVGVAGKTAAITELLFAHGMRANYRNWLGATPLHELARQGDLENAAIFLDHGADIDAVDDDLLSTPLGWAARAGRLEMAEFLLGRGARRALARCPAWAQPVEWARRRGHSTIVALLQ